MTTQNQENVVSIGDVSVGDTLTDAQAEKLLAKVFKAAEEIKELHSQLTTLDAEIMDATSEQREKIQTLTAEINVLRAEAQTKAQPIEAKKVPIVATISAKRAASEPDRQRVAAYHAKRMSEQEKLLAEQRNKFSFLLPSKANALLSPSKPAGTSSGQRHSKGCQDGSLRAKGGVCQLCQSQGKW